MSGAAKMSSAVKDAISQYFTLNQELKAAAEQMKPMRATQKKCAATVLTWLQQNGRTRVRHRYGTLERLVRPAKAKINKERILQVTQTMLGNDEIRAKQIVESLYTPSTTEPQQIEYLAVQKPKKNQIPPAADDGSESAAQ